MRTLMLAKRSSLRQFIRSHLQSCHAFSTSVVVRKETQPFTLPSARLRALITLYHRSSSFITPENLSSRIDSAFNGDSAQVGPSGVQLEEYRALQSHVQRNREKKTRNLVYKSVPLNNFDSATWSGAVQSERKALVIAALWGIQVGGKPSLETVQETRAVNENLGDLLDQTVNPHKLS